MKINAAFTLIELSIVLVIIGLLIGGILVGKDLVETAKIRSVMTELTRLQTATNTFKLKYNCIPGDCIDAVQKGVSDIDVAMPLGNGNGNTLLDSGLSDIETRGFLHHLTKAALISGATLEPISSPTFNMSHVKTKLRDVAITAPSSSTGISIMTSTTDWEFQAHPSLRPLEAFQIDTKMDNANPLTGRIIALADFTGNLDTTGFANEGAAGSDNCLVNTDQSYNISSTQIDYGLCNLEFNLQ